MSKQDGVNHKLYYFLDVNLKSQQIIGWGTEKKNDVEVHLTTGFHRLFLSKGQFNKLEKNLLMFGTKPLNKE